MSRKGQENIPEFPPSRPRTKSDGLSTGQRRAGKGPAKGKTVRRTAADWSREVRDLSGVHLKIMSEQKTILRNHRKLGTDRPPTVVEGDRNVNRKLIRPSLTDIKEQATSRQPRKKVVPPDQTNAENFYYVKQMQAKTPMVIVLADGETINGVIEWYDKHCIKVHRPDGPNLLIYKPSIKYLYKENEDD